MNTAAHRTTDTVLAWTERGLVPDSMIRAGIRRLCRQRLKDIRASDPEASGLLLEAFVRCRRDVSISASVADEMRRLSAHIVKLAEADTIALAFIADEGRLH